MMAVTVKSEMAGVIEAIEVGEGQAVTGETEVIILSSMKMEIPVLAGRAGKVAEILVGEGEAVKVGTPLFTIES